MRDAARKKQSKQEHMKISPLHIRTGAAIIISSIALGSTAHAAPILENYFNFTSYGTVAGGGAITAAGVTGASATVKSTATALTSSGLSITAGSNAGTTGVSLSGSSLSGFTGSFTLQMWFTTPAAIGGNTALFGGTTSASQDNTMVGDQALFASYTNTNLRLRPVVSNNSQYGSVGSSPNGTAATGATLYDYVITYSGTTFTAYLNGVAVTGGSMSVPYFSGLKSLTSGFAIGGIQNPAYGDNAAGANITSFMMYTGALTAGEISTIHGYGSTPTLNQLSSVVVVPEPGSMALLSAGLCALMFFRRRIGG